MKIVTPQSEYIYLRPTQVVKAMPIRTWFFFGKVSGSHLLIKHLYCKFSLILKLRKPQRLGNNPCFSLSKNRAGAGGAGGLRPFETFQQQKNFGFGNQALSKD